MQKRNIISKGKADCRSPVAVVGVGERGGGGHQGV